MSTVAGGHLSGRRSENTAPEVALRKALHAEGARFRIHRQLAKGCTPDIVLPGRHVAVFVDGCFWHNCPEHGTEAFSGPNARLWEHKIERNQVRDRWATATAEDLGWTVVRVWECAVTRDVISAAATVLSASSGAGRDSD